MLRLGRIINSIMCHLSDSLIIHGKACDNSILETRCGVLIIQFNLLTGCI